VALVPSERNKWGCFEPARIRLLHGVQATAVLATFVRHSLGRLALGNAVFTHGWAPAHHLY
jgi:hypothetical protein